MSLDLTQPVLPEALVAARAIFKLLPDVPNGAFDRIYAHWSVAGYKTCFGEYNGMVRQNANGDGWEMVITHDPCDNARGVNNNAPAAHTYRRNTGAFGIAVSGMLGANPHDFGPDPINRHELEYLCAFIGAVAKKYGLDCMATAPGKFDAEQEHVIMTHAEAALTTPTPGYAHYYCYKDGSDPDCRWDLASLDPQAQNPDENEAHQSADLLRQRAHTYKLAV